VGNRKSETSTISGPNSGSFNYNADDEVAMDRYDLNGNERHLNGRRGVHVRVGEPQTT
jgi:hypothetical protein